MVKAGSGLDPFLPRPFALFRKRSGAGELWEPGNGLELLFQVVGKGTRLLSKMLPDHSLEVLGPLGVGWEPDDGRSPVLVGGGMGIASLVSLAEALRTIRGRGPHLFFGAKTAERLWFIEELEDCGVTVYTAAEAGDHPFNGTAFDLLKARWGEIDASNPQLFVCGPPMMVKTVAQWALTHRIPCRVSLEAPMACGVGVCLGCAVKGRDGEAYLRVCRDGPVFDAEQIAWDSFNE
jgi:dihydroorotate dehydrogenase electron transfer subunit